MPNSSSKEMGTSTPKVLNSRRVRPSLMEHAQIAEFKTDKISVGGLDNNEFGGFEESNKRCLYLRSFYGEGLNRAGKAQAVEERQR